MNQVKNKIFIGSYGHVACIDELSGKEVWRTSLPGTGYNPVTCYLEDARLYVGSNGKFFILCAHSGKILDQNEMIGQGYGFLTFATKRSESSPQQNLPQPLPQPGMIPPQMLPPPPPMMHPIPPPLMMPPQMIPPFQVLPQPNVFPQSNEMMQPNNNLGLQSPIFIVSPMINQPQSQQPQQPQLLQFQQPQLLQFEQPQVLQTEQIKSDEEYARQLEKELNGGGRQNEIPNNVNVNVVPQPMFFNPPILPRQQNALSVDDLIFVGLNNYLTALNKYTAQEVWKAQLNSFGGLPVSIVYSKGNLIVGSAGNVSCFNALTGKELWQNKLPGLRYANVSVITTSNNNTIANSSPTNYFQGN